jgi:uncharacterized membrane protein YbhN (UPF0104 family)
VALRALVFAGCLVALLLTVRSLGPRRIVAVALEADPGWLALSLAAIAARYLTWAVKWRRMMGRSGAVAFGTTLRAILSGTFVNLVTPSAKLAGGVLRAVIVQRRTGWRMSLAYGWSVADQVTNVLGDLLLGGLLAVGGALAMPPSAVRRALLLTSAGAVALVLLSLSLRDWAAQQLRRPGVLKAAARLTPARFREPHPTGPAAGWLEPLLSPLLRTGSAWRETAGDVVLAAGSWFLLCVANALVFRALGIEASVFGIAAALVLAVFLGTVSGTIGGIGATEVVLIGLYARLGIPADAAAAAALLHRGTYYGLSLVAGGIALTVGTRAAAIRPS